MSTVEGPEEQPAQMQIQIPTVSNLDKAPQISPISALTPLVSVLNTFQKAEGGNGLSQSLSMTTVPQKKHELRSAEANSGSRDAHYIIGKSKPPDDTVVRPSLLKLADVPVSSPPVERPKKSPLKSPHLFEGSDSGANQKRPLQKANSFRLLPIGKPDSDERMGGTSSSPVSRLHSPVLSLSRRISSKSRHATKDDYEMNDVISELKMKLLQRNQNLVDQSEIRGGSLGNIPSSISEYSDNGQHNSSTDDHRRTASSQERLNKADVRKGGLPRGSSTDTLKIVATRSKSENPEHGTIRSRLSMFISRPSILTKREKAGPPPDAMFGGVLEDYYAKYRRVPTVLTVCTSLLDIRGKEIIGIYRLSGSNLRMAKMKEMFNRGDEIKIKWNAEMFDDLHIVPGLVKSYFKDLKIAVIPCESYDKLVGLSSTRGLPVNERIEKLSAILKDLPESHKVVLKFILLHLKAVSTWHERTRMETSNLAAIFTPLLIRPDDNESEAKIPQELVVPLNCLVEDMINYCEELKI
ncbi:Rho GTPase activation protein [Paraphysoderma sedebokerense]|nr:Rho GTPase activation protein [Paraphysoderma sedebokerense]